MDTERTFDAAAVLSAIFVPLLAVILAVDPLSKNVALVTLTGGVGLVFVLAALVAYIELWVDGQEWSLSPDHLAARLLSAQGLLFVGLLGMAVFQFAQTYAIGGN